MDRVLHTDAENAALFCCCGTPEPAHEVVQAQAGLQQVADHFPGACGSGWGGLTQGYQFSGVSGRFISKIGGERGSVEVHLGVDCRAKVERQSEKGERKRGVEWQPVV
jgi:hypothetical protein